MPIKKPIKPKEPKDLRSKIEGTPVGQEHKICGYVQVALNKYGDAYYEQAEDLAREIELTTGDCIVFLITGSFVVGGTIKTEKVVVNGIEIPREKMETVVVKGKQITRTIILGGTEIAKIGEGHPVVKEGTLVLREDTAVVIIFNPK